MLNFEALQDLHTSAWIANPPGTQDPRHRLHGEAAREGDLFRDGGRGAYLLPNRVFVYVH